MFPNLSPTPSPFDGKPATRQSTDDAGNPVLTVTARAAHPVLIKWSRRIGTLAGISVAIAEIAWLIATLPNLGAVGWVAVLAAPFATPFAFRYGLGQAFQSERIIRFTTEGVEVRAGARWKKFALDLPLRFSLIDHDREKMETERVEYINRKWGRRYWWFPQFRAYYNKSCHLSLDHFDQRNDLMTIYGKSHGRRIVTRLNACLDVVRNHGRAGQGTAFEAEGDWSRQPGGIIDLN